ncbi:MAG: PAS domain S-box protein [Candidatus Lokiarchaeota archaeon]|nr:PAS domain S-box protein [Candidatus Lokiarchaeota archaeon]
MNVLTNFEFKELLDKIDNFIHISDPQTFEILYANELTKRSFGKNIVGKKCYKIFHNYNEPCSDCQSFHIKTLKKEGFQYKETFNKKMGKWLKCSLNIIKLNGKSFLFERAEDITDKKSLEIELKETKSQLTSILENFKDMVFVISKDFKIMFANHEAEMFFGESLKERLCYKALKNQSRICKECLLKEIINDKIETARFEESINVPKSNILKTYDILLSKIESYNNTAAIVEVFRDITEKREIEEKLKKEIKKTKKYLDIASVLLIALNSKGKIILLNNKGCEILECKEKDVIGKNWFNIFIPDDSKSQVQEVFNKLMAGTIEPVEYFENEIITKKGNRRIIAWHNTVLTDDDENIVGILSSGEDVTERKKAEKNLIEIKEMLAEAQRIAHIGNWDWNIEKNTLYWSDEIYRIFGLKPQEFGATYEAFLARVHPEDRKYVVDSVNKALENEDMYSIDHRIILENGKIKHVHEHAEVTFNNEGKPIRMIGTVQDITKRKSTEQKLRNYQENLENIIQKRTFELERANKRLKFEIAEKEKTERKFKTIFKHAGDPIYIHDLEGNIIDVNRIACQQLGYSYAELKKLNLNDIEAPQTEDQFTNQIKNLTEQGTLMVETAHTRKDGHVVPIELSLRMIGFEGQEAVLSIARDLTERKKFEDIRRKFVSTVSHELRTPISILIQSVKNLNKYEKHLKQDDKTHLMESITRNIEILSKLVDDLLVLSKIDEQRISIEKREFNPLKYIKEIKVNLEPRLYEKDLTFKIEIDKDLKLIGDSTKISQIFNILIDNAVKYSKNGTNIKIKAIDHYEGKYNPHNNDGILFSVKDQGIGIPETDLNHLFERFYRSDTVHNIPGTGLGLSIANELIKLHNGKIYVESKFGKGTTFLVFLPYLEK